MTEAISTAANVVPLAAIAGSLATLWWLFQRHIAGQPLLPYEPRRPVPWNAAAPIALLAFVLMPALASAISKFADRAPPADSTELAAADETLQTSLVAGAGAVAGPVAQYAIEEATAATHDAWTTEPAKGLSLWGVAVQAGMSVALTLACHASLAAFFGASRRDLGWPTDWAMMRRDLRIGFVTFLAVIVPVYAMQYLLSVLFSPETQHPLIEELEVRRSSPMLFVAFAAAVVGAPLFEETAFRLILQGWLERITGPWSPELPSELPSGGGPPSDALSVEPTDHESMAEVPAIWPPMIISGVLFAGAHLGQGVAPVSLLPLGIVLGYVYQRTHRILPSIVCHAVFNAFSLIVLWLALTSGESPQ
jgi:membrane protease YdiL (CAAX protease family)